MLLKIFLFYLDKLNWIIQLKLIVLWVISHSIIWENLKIAIYLKEKYRISTYGIPNIECVREHELKKFNVFEKEPMFVKEFEGPHGNPAHNLIDALKNLKEYTASKEPKGKIIF